MSSFRHPGEVDVRGGEPRSFLLSDVASGDISLAGPDVSTDVLDSDILVVPCSGRQSRSFGRYQGINRSSHSTELAAQLAHVSRGLLHDLVPAVTPSAISVPKSLGYTELPDSSGFAQVIERVNGRGPTFLDDGAENRTIKAARREIWDFGVTFGVGRVALVHSDNPFGKPGILISQTAPDQPQRLVWLDFLAAAAPDSRTAPLLYPAFHNDLRAAFGDEPYEFSKINTETMRAALDQHGDKFTGEQIEKLSSQIDLYDGLQTERTGSPRSIFIDEAKKSKITFNDATEGLGGEDVQAANKTHTARRAARCALRAMIKTTDRTPLKLAYRKEPWQNLVRFKRDADYRRSRAVHRRDKIVEGTILRGLKNARNKGQVSQDDYDHALSIISPADLGMYIMMQTGYFVTSRAHDAATVPLAVMAATSSRPAEATAAVVAFNTLSPGLFRAAGTLAVGLILKKNLKRMALTTAAPLVGGHLAVPLQLKRDYGENAGEIMHYSARSLVAGASNVRPHGGWGSDLEEKMWYGTQRFVQGALDTPLIDSLKLNNAERAKRHPARNTLVAARTTSIANT